MIIFFIIHILCKIGSSSADKSYSDLSAFGVLRIFIVSIISIVPNRTVHGDMRQQSKLNFEKRYRHHSSSTSKGIGKGVTKYYLNCNEKVDY